MRALAALGLILIALAWGWFGRPRHDWVVRRPTLTARTGTLPAPLSESSGAAASQAHPGLLWTILDSGNRPEIIAIDSTGRIVAVVELGGSTNQDWESVTLGPCPEGTCVYVADIGDNDGSRASVVLYRLPEPDSAVFGGRAVRRAAEVVAVRYPDGGRDAEATLVTPAGDVIIVTKGLASAVRAYRVPPAAWTSDGGRVVDAELLGELPISPRTALGRWVTGAALAPDGRRVAIRTYRDVFEFVLEPGPRLVPTDPPTLCDISGLETQGEGVAWADDSTLVLTSESGRGAPGTIHYVRCPWP